MENERPAVVVRIEQHWWGGCYDVYETCYKYDEGEEGGMITKVLGEKMAQVIYSAWTDKGESTVEEIVRSYFAATETDMRPMLSRLTEAMNEHGLID